MIVWFTLIVYLLGLRVVVARVRPRRWRIPYLLWGGLGVILVMGLRYPEYPLPNTDLAAYYRFYDRAVSESFSSLSEGSRLERGYIIFNKVMATVMPWPQSILFLHAIIVLGCATYFVRKNSSDVFLGLIFFLTVGGFSFQLTGIRQAVAMSICLLAVELAKRKRLFWYCLIILLAFSMHRSALIFAPFYFLADRKLTVKVWFLLLPVLAIFAGLLDKVLSFGNELVGAEYGQGFHGNVTGPLIKIVIFLAAATILWLQRKRIRNYTAVNMMVIWAFLFMCRYYALIFDRLSTFFLIGVAVSLANGISNWRHDELGYRCLYAGGVSLSIILFLYRASTSDWGDYIFLWQEPSW